MAIPKEKITLPDLFGAPQAERKTIDALLKNDPDKAKEQLDKSKEFAIKMMLAGIKNTDPFAEGNNQANEMLTTANLIAELDSMSIQVDKMTEMAEAIKNPGYNAFELQGKEITYDNSEEYYDGKQAVRFNYELSHQEGNADNVQIKTNINIKNSKGETIFSTRGATQKGAHQFIWDGRDKNGKLTQAGTYSIETEASGSKMIDGQLISFSVTSNSVLSGIVESVEIENSVATRLYLTNGTIIHKNQVKSIARDAKDTKEQELDYNVMGKSVELDLNKIQVKDGKFELYFNNENNALSGVKIEIFDDRNKLVTSLNHDGELNKGFGFISFDKVLVANGNYIAKLSFDPKVDNNMTTPLNNKYSSNIIGINQENKKYITSDNKEIPPHIISSVIGQYQYSIEHRSSHYVGQNINYRDDQFIFQQNSAMTPEMIIKKPAADGVEIDHVLMRIYDQQNQLIAIAKNEQNIENNSNDESMKVKFNWNGDLLNGDKAEHNSALRSDFTIMYRQTESGNIYAGETTFNIANGKVVSTDLENGEIVLNLENGIAISESSIIGT